jgi:hypothetical protein
LLSGGDKETDGVILSSNLAVLFESDVDEPDADEDSLMVTEVLKWLGDKELGR